MTDLAPLLSEGLGEAPDGRLTGGLFAIPPVPKPLCTKAFQKNTGGCEVKMHEKLFFEKKRCPMWTVLF